MLTLPLCNKLLYVFRYFFNFLRTPAKLTRPRLKSNMVAGLGTGVDIVVTAPPISPQTARSEIT